MNQQTRTCLPIGVLICLGAIAARAQSPKLEFEVASVRPAAPVNPQDPAATHGGVGTSDPGRISYRGVSVHELIFAAYGIKRIQLSFPPSLQNKRYDIVAKIPPGTDKKQFEMMLQNLLAERFLLRFHRESKQFDTYRLAVGGRGPKLKETTFKSDDPPQAQRRVYPDGIRLFANHITTVPINGRTILTGGKVHISDLANFLEEDLQGAVTDATGLTGGYDIRLEFAPAGVLTNRGLHSARPENAVDAVSDPAPSIFQALEKQLGLKLEKSEAPLDMFIVDHVEEAPADN